MGKALWREAVLSAGRHCSHVFCRVCAEEALERAGLPKEHDAGIAVAALAKCTGSSSSFLEEQLSLKDAKIAELEARLASALAKHREDSEQQQAVAASLEGILARKDAQMAALEADFTRARDLAAEALRALQAERAARRFQAAAGAEGGGGGARLGARQGGRGGGGPADAKEELLEAKAEGLVAAKAEDLVAAKAGDSVAAKAETRKFRALIARRSGHTMDLELMPTVSEKEEAQHDKCKCGEDRAVTPMDLRATETITSKVSEKEEAQHDTCKFGEDGAVTPADLRAKDEADWMDLLQQKEEVMGSLEADYMKEKRCSEEKEQELKGLRRQCRSLKRALAKKEKTLQTSLEVIIEGQGRVVEKDRLLAQQEARMVALAEQGAQRGARIASLQAESEAHKGLLAEKDTRIILLEAELRKSDSHRESLFALLDAAHGGPSPRKRWWLTSWLWSEEPTPQAVKRRRR